MSYLTLLGTGTCQIEHERRASSVLLMLDNLPVLFDCGHGVLQRLLEAGVRLNCLEHVVLSHFHPDHVSDLLPLLHGGAWSRRDPRSTDLHIYGPAGTQKLLDGFASIFGPSALKQPSYTLHVHEISDERFAIQGHSFDFIDLPPANNHGLRFTCNGKTCAITGDSDFHEQGVAFLKDVDLAIIDAGHLADEQIVELAARSQARHIVCSHLYREIDAARLRQEARQQGYEGTILVGRDLMTFVL